MREVNVRFKLLCDHLVITEFAAVVRRDSSDMTAIFPQHANHGTGHIGCAFRWYFAYQIQLTFTLYQANNRARPLLA